MTISLPNVMKVRFRRGTTELELEFAGNDVPEDQKQIVQELLASFASSLGQPSQMEETEAMAPMSPTPTVVALGPTGRKSRRGGRRKAFVSPAIEKLIDEKWLVEKTTDEVVRKLREDGVVAAREGNVIAALARKVPQRIARIERDDGVTVWTVHTTGG